MANLGVKVDGLVLPNPFIIGSGPPGTNANVIAKAFDEGWGGVVAKTVCLDASKIVNVTPRYARMRASEHKEIIGWENIELISDRPLETWLDEFRELKRRYPDHVLIASVMEEYRRDAWVEIVERCAETGVDGFELNFSCPHGLPERRMGSAMGQDPAILEEVCGWVRGVTDKPVWAKLTPNIMHLEEPARAALGGGATGISAINTILSIMGVNLDTLRPEPTVAGYSTPGGYSGKAIRPIALRMVMECARLIRAEYPGRSLSGLGGVETGGDAAQFLLLGANTVQVCTGVMIHGYSLIHRLRRELSAFMDTHGFTSVDEFRGYSLKYLTTHADLVDRQAAAKAQSRRDHGILQDGHWIGDELVTQSEKLVANR
ncbi:MAG: NAD-dependent dihydropyrimidine dehydrogenase subunit PreA [Phycisphaerales bacterium]|nr:NAD-dependent dihydropyrimidine dehydrogenase subunit PreA [Phycisphaerales bacterium]